MPPTEVVYNDPATWIAAVWEALEQLPETSDEVATAMAWIAEALGVEQSPSR